MTFDRFVEARQYLFYEARVYRLIDRPNTGSQFPVNLLQGSEAEPAIFGQTGE
jgi:hypothetical protein